MLPALPPLARIPYSFARARAAAWPFAEGISALRQERLLTPVAILKGLPRAMDVAPKGFRTIALVNFRQSGWIVGIRTMTMFADR